MNSVVLILGGTGSLGFACAKNFAENGHDLILVCRGRRSKNDEYNFKLDTLRKYGVTADIVKGNIIDDGCRKKVLDLIGDRTVFAMVHAIADGNIGNMFGYDKVLNEDCFLYTLNTMCISFITWTQVLVNKNMLKSGSYVIGFSSVGFYRILPQYAANALAKASLETLSLYMNSELKERGISVFVFRTKMMDTNATRLFDSYEMLKAAQIKENTNKSLTVPEQIASKVISVITDSNANNMKYGIVDLCNDDY